jgi:hypothetical protein
MVVGSHLLEMVEHMLCTVGRPQGQEVMVGVQQSSAATHGDEARVALCGEDHASHSRLRSVIVYSRPDCFSNVNACGEEGSSAHFDDMGVDEVASHCAGRGDPMVAIENVVSTVPCVHLDGWERLTLSHSHQNTA